MDRTLDINADTRVSDILDHYGDIADVMELFGIKRAGPLPVRKFLARFLTLRRAAFVHRVALDEFLPMVQRAVAS